MNQTPLSVWRSFRSRARKTMVVLSSGVARDWPVADWPSWLGRVQDVNVPSRVRPLPEKTSECGVNINIILKMADQASGVPGDFAECGVYRGSTLVPLALWCSQRGLSKTVWGFDSFEGFDESIVPDLEMGGPTFGKRVGGFNETSYEELLAKVQRLRLNDQVRLVKGYFQDTLVRAADRQFSFVHLDCDIYASYRICLEFFYPRMALGGIILLDEYNDPPWPGCTKAVDEFMADKPERLAGITMDNHTKSHIRKQ